MFSIDLKKTPQDRGVEKDLKTKDYSRAKSAAFDAANKAGPKASCKLKHNGKVMGTWVQTEDRWLWSQD